LPRNRGDLAVGRVAEEAVMTIVWTRRVRVGIVVAGGRTVLIRAARCIVAMMAFGGAPLQSMMQHMPARCNKLKHCQGANQS